MDNTFFTLQEVLYLGIWSLIGSGIGYFAFGDMPKLAPKERIKRCLLSIAVGMFISFPIFTYFIETEMFSPKLSLMISGICAFGLPDIILRHSNKILSAFIYRITNGLIDTNKDKNNE